MEAETTYTQEMTRENATGEQNLTKQTGDVKLNVAYTGQGPNKVKQEVTNTVAKRHTNLTELNRKQRQDTETTQMWGHNQQDRGGNNRLISQKDQRRGRDTGNRKGNINGENIHGKVQKAEGTDTRERETLRKE